MSRYVSLKHFDAKWERSSSITLELKLIFNILRLVNFAMCNISFGCKINELLEISNVSRFL